MSTDRSADAAWITVPAPTELPADVADEIGDVSERIGFLPNVARLLAAPQATSWVGGRTSTRS